MREHVWSLNDFKMPKVYESADANYILIIRLLLLEPGKFQSHPLMGVGLKSKWRNNNDENFLVSLQNEIKNQMSTYLPTIPYTDVSLNIINKVLGIIIQTSNGAYVIGYDSVTEQVEAAASYVLDNL